MSYGHAHGEIWVEDNATADTVAVATLTQFNRFAVNGESFDMTSDYTEGHIVVQRAGIYLCSISMSFSGDANVTWSMYAAKNNGTTVYDNVHCDRKLGAGGDVGSAASVGLISLSVDDTVELWMEHDAIVDADITMEDCTLALVKVT